jgi:hypothetical protein
MDLQQAYTSMFEAVRPGIVMSDGRFATSWESTRILVPPEESLFTPSFQNNWQYRQYMQSHGDTIAKQELQRSMKSTGYVYGTESSITIPAAAPQRTSDLKALYLSKESMDLARLRAGQTLSSQETLFQHRTAHGYFS